MSFELHDDTIESSINKAILLYGARGRTSFATIHDVTSQANQPPQIEAGRPLDKRTLKALIESMASSLVTKPCFLPPNILSVSNDLVVWWSPPSLRSYFFDTGDTTESISVGQRSGIAHAPGLIFMVGNGHMRVFAVKGTTRPDPGAAIFHAPLMNVSSNGDVCTGSMRKPQSTVVDAITEWEGAFWESRFSHPNNHHAVRYPGGLHGFSIALLDGRFRRFPERFLLPMRITLQHLLDGRTGIPRRQRNAHA